MSKPSVPTTSYPTELSAAQATLGKSRLIADTIIPQHARSDLVYWFAELYYYITMFEIQDRHVFSHPAFVMHFIPIFYDMYSRAAQQYASSGASETAKSAGAAMAAGLGGVTGGASGWAAGMVNQAAAGAARNAIARAGGGSNLWQNHFAIASAIVDPSQPYLYLKAATRSLVSGVEAHIKGDMCPALEEAYRTFAGKYSNVPAFDAYYSDFFDKNIPIFEKVRVMIVEELVNKGLGLAYYQRSIDPSFALKMAEALKEGLNIKEIFEWRKAAWQSAKSHLR